MLEKIISIKRINNTKTNFQQNEKCINFQLYKYKRRELLQSGLNDGVLSYAKFPYGGKNAHHVKVFEIHAR